MIDIIGHIKVDESKPNRVNHLKACISSYNILRGKAKFILNLENPSTQLFNEIKALLYGWDYVLTKSNHNDNYGHVYCKLLEEAQYGYSINFMEDQLFMVRELEMFEELLHVMEYEQAELCKASFFHVEQNSMKWMQPNTRIGHVFHNNESAHENYCKYYGERFYIGVNFIVSKEFALRFWDRELGVRPHDYEISKYDKAFTHKCVVPNFEIQCAIDDSHGEVGTSAIERGLI